MPRKEVYYEPDAKDCADQLSSVSEDFGCLCEVSVRFANGCVEVVCKARKMEEWPHGSVVVQALVRRPEKNAAQLYTMIFSGIQDIWHQLDRGVLGAQPPAIVHQWSGRPQVRRRPH